MYYRSANFSTPNMFSSDKDKMVVDLNTLDPLVSSSENEELMEHLKEKLQELTDRIEGDAKTSVYDLVERGAIYRKVNIGKM